MITKNKEKELAIYLRRNGKSYSEILAQVPVAKSTISLWLQGVGLSNPQKQKLTEKRLFAAKRGGEAKRQQRLKITKDIFSIAQKTIGRISKRELLLIGVALYWGEGSKQKEYAPSVAVTFTNSDPLMIQVFLKWLMVICGVLPKDITVEIYIHETFMYRVNPIREYWSKQTKLPLHYFDKVYFKKNKLNTKRKNVGDLYHGLLRVKVLSSTNLNRKISGSIEAMHKSIWGIV